MNIGQNFADFVVGEEVACILLLHSLTQQDNIMALPPIVSSSHKNKKYPDTI